MEKYEIKYRQFLKEETENIDDRVKASHYEELDKATNRDRKADFTISNFSTDGESFDVYSDGGEGLSFHTTHDSEGNPTSSKFDRDPSYSSNPREESTPINVTPEQKQEFIQRITYLANSEGDEVAMDNAVHLLANTLDDEVEYIEDFEGDQDELERLAMELAGNAINS